MNLELIHIGKLLNMQDTEYKLEKGVKLGLKKSKRILFHLVVTKAQLYFGGQR